MIFPKPLQNRLKQRQASNSLRSLSPEAGLIDFYSNDYLGFAKSLDIFSKSHDYLIQKQQLTNGSSGSRLLSGNSSLFVEVEERLAKIHNSKSALIFNSGYDANLGLLSSVPQRGDVVLFDKLCHASIRDGLRLSNAKSFAFEHNDLDALQQKLNKHKSTNKGEIYIVTESVFSMDGDQADLVGLIELCQKYQAHLIVDEAHAVGVFGFGLVQEQTLEKDVFARVITFGKALGCHGAVILGSQQLSSYLCNFARSFIYTTALPPIALANILLAYQQLQSSPPESLSKNIQYFKQSIQKLRLSKYFIESNSAIQCCVISGNLKTRQLANQIQSDGFNVKAILSPTVTKGQERLRFCLHSFNSQAEIKSLLESLKNHLSTQLNSSK